MRSLHLHDFKLDVWQLLDVFMRGFLPSGSKLRLVDFNVCHQTLHLKNVKSWNMDLHILMIPNWSFCKAQMTFRPTGSILSNKFNFLYLICRTHFIQFINIDLTFSNLNITLINFLHLIPCYINTLASLFTHDIINVMLDPVRRPGP